MESMQKFLQIGFPVIRFMPDRPVKCSSQAVRRLLIIYDMICGMSITGGGLSRPFILFAGILNRLIGLRT